MRKILSLAVVAAMLFTLLSACANPPGDGGITVKNPSAAAAPKVSNPLDLSVLTKDELEKISAGLLEKLKKANEGDELCVIIGLCPVISAQEARDEAQRRIDSGKVEAEMLDELNILNDQLSDKSLPSEKRSTIIKRSSELRKALESNSILHNQTVGKVLDETNGVVLNEFVEDYGIDITDESDVCSTTTRITRVNISTQTLIEAVKDKRVLYLKSINNDVVFEQAIDSSEVSYSGSYSTSKVNEIYDIIDGEVAVNADCTGDGITIAIIDFGYVDPNVVSDVTCYNMEC